METIVVKQDRDEEQCVIRVILFRAQEDQQSVLSHKRKCFDKETTKVRESVVALILLSYAVFQDSLPLHTATFTAHSISK